MTMFWHGGCRSSRASSALQPPQKLTVIAVLNSFLQKYFSPFCRTEPDRTPNEPRADPERTSRRSRADPEQIPNGSRTNPAWTPNGSRTDLARTPNGPRTNPEQRFSGAKISDTLLDCLSGKFLYKLRPAGSGFPSAVMNQASLN